MDALIQSGAFWYASRATGIVSLLLLTGVVLLGILVNRAGRLPGLPRFAVTGLHRNLSLLSVLFLAVHIVTVILDPYVTIGWAQAIVPWGGTYRPLWVGLGAVAFDLIIALIATSLLRLRMRAGTWRAIHWLAYAAWPVALAHGIGAGTDLRSGALFWLTAALAGSVGLAAGWRVAVASGATPRAERVPQLLRGHRPAAHAQTTATRGRPADRLTAGQR